eukprot:m.183699 g.183699  ORF g.183699 m.183699 type:complete len:1474 (-) comp14696_c0_seq6:2421-6842(-)
MEAYILYSELAKGATSTIFKGRLGGSLTYLALLQIPEEASDEAATRYAATHGMRHPNVCRAILHSQSPDEAWLVSEMCSGITLLDVIECDGPCIGDMAVPMMADILTAVAYVHTQGWVVGDLRPEKFLVRDNHLVLGSLARAFAYLALPDVKSTDDVLIHPRPLNFDTCSGLWHRLSALNATGCVAPEVLQTGLFSLASDLWATGTILLRLVTDTFPPLSASVAGSLPAALGLLLEGLLDPNPTTRFRWSDVLALPLTQSFEALQVLAPNLVQVDCALQEQLGAQLSPEPSSTSQGSTAPSLRQSAVTSSPMDTRVSHKQPLPLTAKTSQQATLESSQPPVNSSTAGLETDARDSIATIKASTSSSTSTIVGDDSILDDVTDKAERILSTFEEGSRAFGSNAKVTLSQSIQFNSDVLRPATMAGRVLHQADDPLPMSSTPRAKTAESGVPAGGWKRRRHLKHSQQEQQEQQQQHPLVQSKGQHQQPESVGKSESRSPIVHRRHTEDEVIGTTQAHGLMDVPDAATERRSFASHGKQDAADQQEESRPHSSAKFEPYASVSRSDQHPQEEAPMDDVPHLEPVHVTMTHVTNPLVTERLDQLNPHQLLSACATRLAMTHLQGAGNGRTDMSATGILADGPQQVCAELVVVESDLIVVPIFNPKVKPPKFDANSLGIPYVAKEDVCAMDDEKLAEFLASIMTALEIKPQSRQKSRASSRQRPHSGKADRSKIHLLSYVYNLVGDTDIANIFANSPVMPALCASFRTMPDFARERQAMVIGRILQTATMVFVEVDMGHILHLLSDALRDNFRTTKLKPLLASCLGEAMFYAATQHNAQEEQLPEHWTIPMIALKMIFKCLGRDEHSSVQLPAIRTIENLASTPGEHMQHLKRQDVMLTAWRVLFHSNNASIRRACASTLMHLSILDPGLCQGLIDNAGADHIVDVLADSNTRVQQATLTCCLSLFANPSAIPSRAVSALADSPQTYSNLLRCVKSKSLAVKAKAFLLLGLLLPREPSALCAALSTSAGLHSGLDQLMNEIKRINNDMIVDEDAEMLHYLQKCAMSFVHAVSVWAPTYVIELLEAFQGVEGRRNPTPLRSKRLFDLLEQLVLLDAVVQCDVFVALLAQHHIPDYLQMLFYVAEVSVADTMVPDASRDDIHKYISQIYTVVTRVIQFAPTELPLHLARLASIVVHFAESSRDALQMAVHTYAIASKLVHERNQWDRASATFLESEDLLAALPMLPSFILACQTSPAPVSSLVNHFLIDLWLAVQSGWQHNFMSSALVEQSLHQLQSMVDILSAAELESVQLPTYSTDRDSSLVVSNVLFIASAASPDSIFKWLIAHRIAVRVSLGFITELKALQSEYGEIESLESKLDCLDGITTFLLTILKLVNTKLGKSKFKSKQRAIEQHMAATLCLPEAIVQALSLIGDSKPELTQKLQLALVLICEGLGGSVPNLSPYRTFHTQVDTTLLDLLV